MSVRSWPTYLLRDIPETTRAAIEVDAELDGVSMIEVVRAILCAHYELDCPPVETLARHGEFIPGTGTMVLRLPPELFDAINEEFHQAGSAYGAKRKIVLDILTAHYNGGHPQ